MSSSVEDPLSDFRNGRLLIGGSDEAVPLITKAAQHGFDSNYCQTKPPVRTLGVGGNQTGTAVPQLIEGKS
jgi:hypothetical protein